MQNNTKDTTKKDEMRDTNFIKFQQYKFLYMEQRYGWTVKEKRYDLNCKDDIIKGT